MKTTLWLTTFTMLAASPLGFSNTELETLRSMVTERDRQIRQLEEENMKLRSLNGENVKVPVKAAPGAPAQAAAAPAAATYTVKAGDTLAKISRKVGGTPEGLARLNGIKDPSKLRIGQKLKLPGGNAAGNRAVAAAPAAPAPAAQHGDTYVVRDGDTFYSIARKYKVSAESLIAANPDIKPSAMRTGQLVRLQGKPAAPATVKSAPVERESHVAASKPVETVTQRPAPEPAPVAKHPATPATPAASHAPAPSPAKAQDSPAPVTPVPAKSPVRSVVIDGEMTYGEFAAKHGMQVERLNELNGLDLKQNTVLAKGSEFYVNAQP